MSVRGASRWRALLALLRPDARRWVGLGALLALGSALMLVGPLVVRGVVDRAADGAATAEIVRLALAFLAVAVAIQVIAVVVARQATVAAWSTTNDIRLRITRHVLGLDHEFHRTHTPGELIQRVDGDVTSVSDFLGQVVPKIASGVLLVGGMLVVLTVLDWRLGLGMAVYLAGSLVVVVTMRHRAVSESSDEMGAYARLYGGIEERLTAAEDLRANGAGVHAMWRFVEDSAGALDSSVRRERAFLRLWWAVQGSVAAGSALSLVLSAALVTGGVLSVGTAFLLYQYVRLMSRPLEDIVHELETVQKASGAMTRVIDLLELTPTIVDRGTTCPPAGPLAIRFTGVGFDYGDDRQILHDVDVEIDAGRSVGIVGRTGSGKTTFSRLLLRLVEATSGTVELGGVPIADIPLPELRRRVALVPQEVELFEGTLRDNVTLFDPAPSDDDVAAALGRAGLG
ncbi:MAG: ABC transporter ATP-binding protein, partial [Acidimicrobiia bacterium]|nr:ABC transporter ATP-binding protein [Acidimicrobiia bacterium]